MSAHTDPVKAIARRFLQTLAAESRQHDNPEPLPARLARAAAVLPIEGVGLLLHKQPDRWTPLGASNETVALVQRLHDTVSDSPCQVAAETKSPVIATEELLTQRWPLFADLLLRQTPVRSMLVMPLSGRLHGRAFAVFCSATPAGVTAIPMIELCVVTGLLSQELGSADDGAPWPQALASNSSAPRYPHQNTHRD